MLRVEIGGSGHASLVGRYAYAATECFNPVSGAYAGSFTITAANGDRIAGTYAGQVSGTSDPAVAAYRQTMTVISGTGRFAGTKAPSWPTVSRIWQPVHTRNRYRARSRRRARSSRGEGRTGRRLVRPPLSGKGFDDEWHTHRGAGKPTLLARTRTRPDRERPGGALPTQTPCKHDRHHEPGRTGTKRTPARGEAHCAAPSVHRELLAPASVNQEATKAAPEPSACWPDPVAPSLGCHDRILSC